MRVQFEITAEQSKKIEELMKKTGTTTKKDLLNDALSMLQWAVRQVSNGRVVGSIDEKDNSYRELNTPTLEHASSYGKL
jgi:hypothetical protein